MESNFRYRVISSDVLYDVANFIFHPESSTTEGRFRKHQMQMTAAS
jgi:hypothetical protein